MAGDGLVGEAVGAPQSDGPAGAAAAARPAAAASHLPQWLAISPSWWVAAAAVGAVVAARVGADRVGAAVGVTVPPVGAVAMDGPPGTAAAIPLVMMAPPTR